MAGGRKGKGKIEQEKGGGKGKGRVEMAGDRKGEGEV
jgi:hypothetical protein